MTSYAEIFKLALQEIDDPSLAKWPEEELSNELYGWLQKAIGKLPKLRTETAERDDFKPANADKLGFANDLSDTTKTVLALGIKRQWLAPQIASTTITWQRYSKKEGYSQKEHLMGLMELDKETKLEMKKLLRDDTYEDNEYFD
jgi:hypothetical protein